MQLDDARIVELRSILNSYYPEVAVPSAPANVPFSPTKLPQPDVVSAKATIDMLTTGEMKVDIAGKKMTQTTYTHGGPPDIEKHGYVTWWRIGNDIEVYDTSLTHEAFRAFIVKQAAVFEANPKLKLLRWKNALDNHVLDSYQGGLVKNTGAAVYNEWSLKLTREQVFDMRDTVLGEVAAAAAPPSNVIGESIALLPPNPAIPEPVVATVDNTPLPAPTNTPLLDEYGWNQPLLNSLGTAEEVKQSGAYSKVVWKSYSAGGAESGHTVTVRWARLKTELVWDRVFGDPIMLSEGQVRSFLYLVSKLDADDALKSIRFERLPQLTADFKQALLDHGAQLSGETMTMTTANAQVLANHILTEMGSDTLKAAAAAVPVPKTYGTTPGIWDTIEATPEMLMPVAPVIDTLPNDVFERMWPNEVSTFEKAEALPDGTTRLVFVGMTHSPSVPDVDSMATLMSELNYLASGALDTKQSLAIRAQVFEVGGDDGPGALLRKAMIDAGAVAESDRIILDGEVLGHVYAAISDNTPISAVEGSLKDLIDQYNAGLTTKFYVNNIFPGSIADDLPDTVPPGKQIPYGTPWPGVAPYQPTTGTPTPKSTGASLAAQFGYDESIVKTLNYTTTVSPGAMASGSTSGAFGLQSFKFGWSHGKAPPGPGIVHADKALFIAAEGSAATTLNAQVSLVKWLDAHMDGNPDLLGTVFTSGFLPGFLDMTKHVGGAPPLGQPPTFIYLSRRDIHRLAMKIDNDVAFDILGLGSAAEPVAAVTTFPDVLPLMGFNDTDVATAGLFDQHTQPLHGMSDPGPNAASYNSGAIESGWQATPTEIIWDHLFVSDPNIGAYEMRRAALAEIRRFGKWIEAQDMESMLVTGQMLDSGAGFTAKIRDVLVAYGGKTQNSGAVVIKRAELTNLWKAIEEQTGVAAIAGVGVKGTMAQVGLYTPDTFTMIQHSVTAQAELGTKVSNLPEYTDHYSKSVVAPTGNVTAAYIWGWKNAMLEWNTFIPAAGVPTDQVHAIAAAVFYDQLKIAWGNATGLLIKPLVLDSAPGVRAILEAAGLVPGPDGSILILPGSPSALMDALDNNTVPPLLGVAAPPGVAAQVKKIEDLIYVMQQGTMDFNFGNSELKALGHPGIPLEVHGEGAPVGIDFANSTEVVDAWDAGTITTAQANGALNYFDQGGMGIGTVAGHEVPAYLGAPAPGPVLTTAEKLNVIDETLGKVYGTPLAQVGEAIEKANAVIKPLGHPGITLGDVTKADANYHMATDVVKAWNEGKITSGKADELLTNLQYKGKIEHWKLETGVLAGASYDEKITNWPAYLVAPTTPVVPTVPVAPAATLDAQMTGKSADQLATLWTKPAYWQSGSYKYADTTIANQHAWNATDAEKAITPTQTVKVGTIDYKARRIITSPHHGKPPGADPSYPGVGTGSYKGRWSGGSDAQRAEVLWVEFKNSVYQAISPTAWGHVGPKPLFVHADATRLNPKIKEIMEKFGAKKKTIKQQNIGTGWEVPKTQIVALRDFLDANQPFTPKFTGVLTPAPPPPAAAIPAPSPVAGTSLPPVAPTIPTPTPVAPPPPAVVTMGSAYGYDQQALTFLELDVDSSPSSLTSILKSKPDAKTLVYEDHWSNNVTVTYAAEPMTAKTKVLRIRKVDIPGMATPASLSAGTISLLASVLQMPDRMNMDTAFIALLIDKQAIAGMPGIGKMLKDAGWKETTKSWTFKRELLPEFVKQVELGKAPWMPASALPTTPVAAVQPTVGVGEQIPNIPPPAPLPPAPLGPPPAPPEAEPLSLAAAPKKASPTFIYGYDDTRQKQIGQTLMDVDRPDAVDALGKPVQEGVQAFITAHAGMQAHWSVSKSTKAVGWTNIVMDPALSQEEARDAAFAMLRHIAAQGSVREKFFISPAAYDQVQGLRQMLLDAGGSEQTYNVIGTAVEISAEQASVLVKALDTNTMSGLKVSINTTSDYLGFDGAVLESLDAHPNYVDAYHHKWTTGDEEAISQVVVDLDDRVMQWQDITGPSSSARALAAMSQFKWAADQGIEELTLLPAVVHAVPNLDRWSLSLGATIEDGNLVFDAQDLNNARRYIIKNRLPDLLGGTKLPYSVVDELNTSPLQVVEALHNELVSAARSGKKTAYTIGGREVTTRWTRSDSNLYWSAIERGDGASIGQMRTAAGAELRTMLNDIAQNGGLQSLDVSVEVLQEVPSMRAVLLKYGAKEVPAKGKADAYISLARSKALKLRADVEAELTEAIVGVAGVSFISQHNALVKWPSVDVLTPSESEFAKTVMNTGQTRKAVFVDPEGNEWLFKPGATGRGAAADVMASQLSEMLGLAAPPVHMYTLEFRGELVQGSLQKMVPAKGMKDMNYTSPKDLSPKHTEELMRHSVVDWVMNNDDAHIGNWLIDSNDVFWAIDRTRAYTSFHTAQDVLDTMSEGNMGGTPWLFQFFRDARANPALLAKIHPYTFAQPLRRLRAISDEQFLKMVDPLATAKAADRTRGGAYYGKKEKLLADMLARKHEAAGDFGRYVSNEIQYIARTHPGQIPPEWQAWVDNGAVINLEATPRDLLLERKAALEAKWGVQPGRTAVEFARDQMNATKFNQVASKVNRYFGGSGMFGGSHWEAEKIIPKLKDAGAEHLVAEWRELNELAVLNIVEHPTELVGSNYDLLRRYYNAEKGVFRVTRTTSRFNSSDPAVYIPGYRRAGGLRGLFGSAVGKYVWVGASSRDGVGMWMDVNPNQVFSNFALGFNPGESEILVLDARLDQIVRILPGSQATGYVPPDFMDYVGPIH